jgi:amino acid transporter
MTSISTQQQADQRAPRRTLRERLHLTPNGTTARAFHLLFGRPLATDEAQEQKVGAWRAVPVLGLDGLASASYGPEAALAILLPLGALGLACELQVIVTIVALLALLYFSYRQTIVAYPNGGGSFSVARENLGRHAGLVAAASLLLDYVLNVAVGIAAGVGALESVFPALQPHRLAVCLTVLTIVAFINLRGVRESGVAWMLPTYGFLLTLGAILLLGVWKTVAAGGHPAAVVAPAPLAPAMEAATPWIVLRAFAAGCTAMTGVEAVSNGVPIFREPRARQAQLTLTIICAALAALLLGIGFLVQAYGIGAMRQESPAYRSVVSQIVEAVAGRGPLYFTTMACVLSVLTLSANTSFAGFPRLCGILAQERFLPPVFANLGRRLVYTSGIVILMLLSGALLIGYEGVTDRLIPLFAVGAFGAFTMSQAGMVVHWYRQKRGNRLPLAINALGTVATLAALMVIVVAKFEEGAWMVVVVIPVLVAMFETVRHHHDRLHREIAMARPLQVTRAENPLVVIPIEGWNRITERALRFALRISNDITAVHITAEPDNPALREEWAAKAEAPARAHDVPVPRLEIVTSPYREILQPILVWLDHTRAEHPRRTIAIIIPELVQALWWENLLHSHIATGLKAALLLRRDDGIVVINVPWYLREE